LGGRNIMTNVLALYEFLHDKKRKGKVGIILKLEFEKAYDKVYLGFLMKCWRMRGFCEKWCMWIESVLYNGIVAVRLNGNIDPYLKVIRGSDKDAPFHSYCLMWLLTALLEWLLKLNRIIS
jgi:hypothetical protein